MAAQWPAKTDLLKKRWGGVTCWRNNWGRIECRQDNDNQSFFQSTGIWVLIGFLIFAVVLAIVALVCCLFLRGRKSRSRSRSSSRTSRRVRRNNGNTWYRRDHYDGGRRNNDGYTGSRRGDVDHGPPPEGYYARRETAYPTKERGRERSRSRERRKSLEEKKG